MQLHVQQEGRGDDLVLLHGWGLHGGIWDPIVPALARDWRVTRIDLPGHGRSPWPDQGAPSLDELMSGLVAAAPRRAVWLGWSLGGMLALRLAARLPQRVRGLVLVAATPKFVEGPDWPHGMERTLLEDFRNALENDYARTLMRFLALQSRPGDHAAQEMRVLRRAVFAHGHPQREGLSFGLRLLEEMDLRRELTAVQCSSLWVTGDRDVLVPHEAAQAAAREMPRARVEVIRGAAHTPFLSHGAELVKLLGAFRKHGAAPPEVTKGNRSHAGET